MDKKKNLFKSTSDTSSLISQKRDEYITGIKDQAKQDTLKKKRNLGYQYDDSKLHAVQDKIRENFNIQSEEERKNPGKQLAGISEEDLRAALMVRAQKLLHGFDLASKNIPTIVEILDGWIPQCRDQQWNYYSKELEERAKKLADFAEKGEALIDYLYTFTDILQNGTNIEISTAIIGSGVVKEKLEEFVKKVESEGIDVQTLKEANKKLEEALEGVEDYKL